MLRRLAGLVFNRWLLLALLAAFLLAAVWWVGPLVAVGEHRPLDGERARWVASAVVLGGCVLAAVLPLLKARRGNARVVSALAAPAAAAPEESADLKAVRARFEQALALLRDARFAGSGDAPAARWRRLADRLSARFLYELPWYLIIGAPGSGKTTALRNAGLRFPLADRIGEPAVRGVGGTRDCDWWFADNAVLIDTAGRFTTQDSHETEDRATWNGFLALLERSRPRQPLNGVLVTVAVPDLLARGAAERQRHAQAVRARLQELHEQLGIRLPIYLFVTKCDLVAGFGETFSALDRARRAEPWGFTFGVEPRAWQQAFEPEFAALQRRLDEGLVDRLQAEPDPQRRQRIYGFPNQFATLHAPLSDWLRQVFAPSRFEADPMLRGVYFVSGTQEGSPIDRVLGTLGRRLQLEQAMLPAQRASGRSFFLEQVLSAVVFAEQGLAGTDRRWERRRGALAASGYAALALLAGGALLAWWTSWRGNVAYVAAVGERVDAVRRLVQETPNRASSDLLPLLPALRATGQLAGGGDGEPAPWRLRFGLYQGEVLERAARAAYAQMLHDAVLPRLALRTEEQLRDEGLPETHYEALKAYLMLYEPARFDAAALQAQVHADWDARFDRALAPEQRAALEQHLEALLAEGPAVSPLPRDDALVQATRNRLAVVPLPQRVWTRMRQQGFGDAFPEFTVVRAGGGNAPLVFTRASGLPLTRGVPGLFTWRGYHEGFQQRVGDAARQLADEQPWVLGVAATEARGAQALFASDRLVDEVRRLYLLDYRDAWKQFVADLRMLPPTSVSQALERTRFLAAPDNPLVPLMKAISRETTLLAGGGLVEKAERDAAGAIGRVRGAVREALVGRTTAAASGERIERIVDDEFAGLRMLVTAPEGGKAPIDGIVARLGELQVLLTATEAALRGGAAPAPSPLPNQLRAEAQSAPEPLRSMLASLAATSARVALLQLRESLSREVRSQVGEFCQQAAGGRYPLDPRAAREMTPADFSALFGPGGRFEQMQQKLAAYVDTSTRPWSFRPVDGTPLGGDVGTLPQFQRAAAIRETFFAAGSGPATQLVFKPVQMDTGLREFVLDVDGQIVRYDHGPQIPQTVRWPGPRGTNVVRVAVQPAGTGIVRDGPWALFRLFEQVGLQPLAQPEQFRATFDIDGRKVVFDVTASSVRNPFRMAELRGFQCPQGL